MMTDTFGSLAAKMCFVLTFAFTLFLSVQSKAGFRWAMKVAHLKCEDVFYA